MFVFETLRVYNGRIKYLKDMNINESLTDEREGLVGSSNKIKRIPHEGLFMSVTKKAEKIATALYMLTDLIPEGDPMRHQIRKVSLSVLSDTRMLTYSLTGDVYFHVGKIISKSWEIVSLTEVCVVVGFISDMNYRVLKNALVDFIGDLRNKQRIEGFKRLEDMKIGEGEASNITLNSDFFQVTEQELRTEISQTKNIKDIDKGHNKAIVSFKNPVTVNKVQKSISENSDNKMTERKAKIQALVIEKKDISIRDILLYFKDFSSKTILRDLNALIEEGKIKKTGDRRWSRYSVL